MYGDRLMLYLFMVAIEQSEEARLGASRSLHSTETKIVARTLDVAQIPEQFLIHHVVLRHSPSKVEAHLNPKSRSFPNGSELSGLEMSEPKGGKCTVLRRKSR